MPSLPNLGSVLGSVINAFDNPILDGIAPSWCDIAVRIKPQGGTLIEMGDIQAIDSGWDVEIGEQKSGGRVIKRTRGTAKYDASMTLYVSGYQKLLRGLASGAPSRGNQKTLSLLPFSINVQFTPPGATDIFEFRLKGCRILGRKVSATEGNDAQLIELPLNPIEICDVIDGVEVVAV